MKKIVISTLAVLMACPAFAGTQKGGSDWQMFGLDPYIALRGGLGYTNMNYSYNDHKEAMSDMEWQGRAAKITIHLAQPKKLMSIQSCRHC